MRLADDEITVTVGHEILHLRPTLRAAFRLERRHGGFDKIVKALGEESVTVIADILREGADYPTNIPDMLLSIGTKMLGVKLGFLVPPLIDFVFLLAGVDPKAPDEPASGERVSYADYHTRLYRLGTGWLNWTPAETWDATAAEITEAYAGRLEMLRHVFGSGATEPQASNPPNAAFDPAGWDHLKMLVATGGNRNR